jgi:uncharacterized DUF497 family protein
MRFDWDDAKSDAVKAKRDFGFDELLPLFQTDYLIEVNTSYDNQFLAIGFLGTKMLTIAIEYREDEEGDYIWIVTYWESTKPERIRYANEKK